MVKCDCPAEKIFHGYSRLQIQLREFTDTRIAYHLIESVEGRKLESFTDFAISPRSFLRIEHCSTRQVENKFIRLVS